MQQQQRILLALLGTTGALVFQAPQSSRTKLLATYQVTLEMPDGVTATIPVADDEFILDAAEEAGFELPSSCRSGACTSCQGRVLKGSISMEDQDTLEEEHIAAGYVCTCIAYPESDVTIKTHQMDNFENGVMEFDDVINDAAAVAEPVAAPEPTPEPAPAPAPVVAAAPAPAPAPAPVPVAEGPALDSLKVELAKKTLAMFKDVVAGRSDLEAKCDELAALLDGEVAPVTTVAKAEPEYTEHRCDDVGYTIWLNKNDYRNSWYEYHKKDPKKK